MISKTVSHSVSICIILFLASVQVLMAETIFVDRFDDGDAEDGMPVTWVPQLGAWDASTGDYVASGPSPKITVVPEHILTETSIRAQVRAGGNVGVGLGVRRGPGPVGYSGVLLPDGRMGFNRVDGAPVPVLLGFTNVPLNLVEQDVMLQVDAFGSELSIWAWPVGEPIPNEPQFVVSDSTYASGSVGLIASLAGDPSPFPAVYRFVHVANTHIPEPSTLVLLSVAGIGLFSFAGKRKQRAI